MSMRGHDAGRPCRLRTTVMLAVAYGMFLTVTSTALWGSVLSAGLSAGAPSPESDVVGFMAREATFAITFILVAAWSWRGTHGCEEGRQKADVRSACSAGLWISLVCLLAGTLLGAMGSDAAMLQSWGKVVSATAGALLGIGCALAFCLLQDGVATLCGVYQSGQVVFAAAAVSAVLYFILKLVPDGTLSLLAFFALTAVLYIMIWRIGTMAKSVQTSTGAAESRVAQFLGLRNLLREIWKPMVCVSMSAFIIGMIRLRAAVDAELLAHVNDSAMLSLLIAAAALTLAWRVIYSRVALLTLHQILFPLIATAYLVLPAFSGVHEEGFIVFANTVFSVASSLMVVTCVGSSRRNGLPHTAVYGIFAGVAYTALLLGSVVGLSLGIEQGVSQAVMFVIAMGALYIMAMVLVVPRDFLPGKKDGVEAGLEPEGDLEPEGGLEPEGVEAASPKGSEPEARLESALLADSGLEPDRELTIDEKCALLSERYQLSRRETEIFPYLAKGRDVQFVANELVLSKNTIKTHVKNIFMKLDVHSRQEIIDLVESFKG